MPARLGGLSSAALASCAESRQRAINPIVYAEVSIGFARIEALDEVLAPAYIERRPPPDL